MANSSYDYVKICLKIVFKKFSEIRKEIAIRSNEDQNTLGDLITSTEIELDKKIKGILDTLPASITDDDNSDVSNRKNPLVDTTNKSTYEHISDCIKIIEKEFYERIRSMGLRHVSQREVIGDLLVRLQTKILNDIKKILDECYVPPTLPLENSEAVKTI